jgi:hypothetical protein
MGCMSASDAAPLPRLGEVFFDVRGESRSMRLSWYADTGVAVFSIWQGGTCTGTFRLPIADLPRMVDSLQRGPHARDDLSTGEQPASREPRPPGPPRLPDGDFRTGQTTGAIYLPPVESDLTGYQAEPPLPDYPGEYAAGPPAPDFPGEYQAPLAQGYPGEDPHDYLGGPNVAAYHSEPAGGYAAEETLSAGYHGDYQEGSLGAEPGGLRDDPLAADPAHGYRRESRGRYPAGRAARTDPARRGYRSEEAAGPASGDYADGPPPGGYPDGQDYQDYQHYHEELPAPEYGSPVRPYLTDARDTDEPFADEPPQRRKPRGRRRAEPAPESFPYGPPPAGDEPRQRGPYPGQH